jgi:hydrogenase nickel incorporation protein HypA/HybF
MHEYSLIQALLDRVEAEAHAHRASAVSRLRVSIGEQAGVERELFATAYELCRAGTLCEKAELEINTVPARFACRLCGREVAPGEILSCPDCGSPARLLAGDEITLDRIEMELA